MKWKAKVEPKPYSKRTVRRFLLFPKKLPVGSYDGVEEWRWMEMADIRQQYIDVLDGAYFWKSAYWIYAGSSYSCNCCASTK